MSIVFLGESIHGVSEFTSFKRKWISHAAGANLAVVFEADHVGMLRSALNRESPKEILLNFPRIHRTTEMLALLADLVGKGVPFFGADVITRNKEGGFRRPLAAMRLRQVEAERFIYSQVDPFSHRDEYMAEVIASVAADHPGHVVVGLFHNLHIKKQGSRECEELRLHSVAECLCEKHRMDIRSIGLFASGGSALHNDLTPFRFEIRDDGAVEHLATASNEYVHFICPADVENRTAYHHAFTKETLPVRENYDECVVFPIVTPPSLAPL